MGLPGRRGGERERERRRADTDYLKRAKGAKGN